MQIQQHSEVTTISPAQPADLQSTETPVEKIIRDFRYRPDVDGLRAIAVLPVVLYHAGLGFSGGYIGVDVFFVISGFLITSLIIKDLENKSFTIAGFYQRRARRIAPALIVVILCSLIAGWFLLEHFAYADLGASAIWQALFAANFYFWRSSGYFARAAEDKPLLHTWSLAVEEQFYVFVPLILLAMMSNQVLRRRSSLISAFILGMVGSFAASLYGVGHHPSATFYLLPFRTWELLCGSLVAVLPAFGGFQNKTFRELISNAGLLGILIPCFLYTKSTPFPGLAAAPPCIGAAMIIWSNAHLTDRGQMTLAGRLLANPLFVFIGLISYSLYLWHWPILAFSTALIPAPFPITTRWALVVISVVMAVLSWAFVETPFRKRTLCRSDKRMFQFAGIGIAVSILLGGVIAYSKGIPQRLPTQFTNCFASEPEVPRFWRTLKPGDIAQGKLVPFGNQDSQESPRLMVWGDSHAAAALPALDALFRDHGIPGIAAVSGATPPLIHLYRRDHGLKHLTPQFSDEVIQYIKEKQIKNVVLIARWNLYDPEYSAEVRENLRSDDPSVAPSLKSSILQTAERLKDAGCQTWVQVQVPEQTCDVRKALFATCVLGKTEFEFSAHPESWSGLAGNGDAFLKELTSNKIHVINPRPAFLDQNQAYYRMSVDGKSIYLDRDHVNVYGAEAMLRPVFEMEMKSLVANGPVSSGKNE